MKNRKHFPTCPPSKSLSTELRKSWFIFQVFFFLRKMTTTNVKLLNVAEKYFHFSCFSYGKTAAQNIHQKLIHGHVSDTRVPLNHENVCKSWLYLIFKTQLRIIYLKAAGLHENKLQTMSIAMIWRLRGLNLKLCNFQFFWGI